MNAEATRVTNAEIWTEWESRVVNGVFPLRRFLGRSNHSAVFVTEYKAENLPNVAIKFVPADPLQTEARLVQWGAAATLSHPHLLRIFDVGRCQFRGRGFLFVVMEYAEQTLAQILPQRALTADEVREMLPPTLAALAFLHRNNLVQGQLKPSNVLVVNDQLKLATDTVRPIGNSASGIARASLYDPPELKDGAISTAGDVWGLGITLVEALTQRTPTWPDERSETAPALLPTSFPAPFVDTVQRCLSRTLTNRPTITELETQYRPVPQQVIPVHQPPAREPPREASRPHSSPKKQVLLPVTATVFLILLAVWVGLRFSQHQPDAPQVTTDASEADLQSPEAPTASAPAAERSAVARSPAASNLATPGPAPRSSTAPNPAAPSPSAATSPSVLHQVMPEASQVILDKIRGHINITVRVLVDSSGNVVGEFLENAGPSRYFARVAGDAAVEWKFAPAETQGPRVWLLRFEFTRGGATVDATAAQ